MTAPHRTPARRAALAAAALVAVGAALLGEALFTGRVLAPLDALLQFEPWASVAPEGFRPANPLLLDQAVVMLPWLEFFAERARAGEWPLWSDANYAGFPVHAAYTGGLLWPLHWLYLALPDFAVLAWIALAKVVLAGLGMRAFLRQLGRSELAAFVGAAGYALCGFTVAWLQHPHTNVALLLPWALALVETARRRCGAGTLVGAAALAALAGVAGHAQTALHVALAVGAWAAFRALPGPDRLTGRAFGHLALGALLGLGLAAPAVMPFAEYVGHSRGAEVLAADELVAEPPLADAAVMLVAPSAHGDPRTGDYAGPEGPHLNHVELVGGFVGRALLLLALAALLLARRERATWALAAGAALALGVAWGVPGLVDAARAVPGLRDTKLLRLSLVAAAALCALGAGGLDALRARVRAPRASLALALAACVVVPVELLAWGRGYNPAIDRALALPPTETAAFLRSEPGPVRALGTEGAFFAPGANAFVGVPVLTGYDSIEDARLADLVGLLTTDERAAYFVHEIRWFDRLVPLASLLGVTHVLSRTELPAPLELAHTGELLTYRNPTALPRAFAATGVVLAPDPAARLERLGSADLDPRVALVEGPPPPGFDLYARAPEAPPATVSFAAGGPRDRVLEVDLPAPSLIVVSQTFDPGWTATAAGAEVPMERVSHALTGLWLPAGRATVTMRYAPKSFSRGLAIAGASALALAALGLALARRPVGGQR